MGGGLIFSNFLKDIWSFCQNEGGGELYIPFKRYSEGCRRPSVIMHSGELEATGA